MITTALTAAITSVATGVATAVATPFSNRLQSLIEQAPVTPLITVPASVGALVITCCYPLWRGKVGTSGRWAAAVATVVLWPFRRIQWPQGLRSWAGRMLLPLAVGYIAAWPGGVHRPGWGWWSSKWSRRPARVSPRESCVSSPLSRTWRR
ncbi:hypothetical protein B1L11_31820 [Microbispora sp. GKU 823]|nr:hypothetical protein B1L11_31820 [Microbispora sp. GKU 823]